MHTSEQVTKHVTEKCHTAGVSKFEVIVLPAEEHRNTFEIIKNFL